MKPASRMVGAVGVLALASCSLVLDADAPQCSSTDDCVARGAAFAASICVDSHCAARPPVATLSSADAGPPQAPYDPADPWRCVGHVAWPATTGEPLLDHEVFRGFLDGRPAAGLAIDVCANADVECTSPLATVTTDAAGAVAIPITNGFTGYVQLTTPPPGFPGLMPTIIPYVLPAGTDPATTSHLCASCTLAGAAFVTSRGEVNALAASVDAVLDPSRGLIVAGMADCDNRPAAGVHFELTDADQKSTPFYFKDGLPNLTATETGATGEAGFINLRPGPVAVRARLTSSGKLLSTRTVLVRAGTITIFSLPPTPL